MKSSCNEGEQGARVLNKYGKNIKSQNGEDGILEYVFSVIGEESRRCVEFGAWDGEHLSNTWNLIVNKGWQGIFIEADKTKYASLCKKFKNNNRVVAINRFVESEGENKLDNILKEYSIPRQIDLLSIDVDGNEWQIWNGIKEYVARVVVIEHNPTIPPHIELVGEENTKLGSSVLALCNLGKRKGYELICCTTTNSIFVLKNYLDRFNIKDNSPEKLFPKTLLTYVISTYDGQLIFSKEPIFYFSKGSIKKFVRRKIVKREKLDVYSVGVEDMYEVVPLYYKKIKKGNLR